jgi:hypothetical protein
MLLPKRVYETLWGVLFTSLLFLSGSSATMKPSPRTWGENSQRVTTGHLS